MGHEREFKTTNVLIITYTHIYLHRQSYRHTHSHTRRHTNTHEYKHKLKSRSHLSFSSMSIRRAISVWACCINGLRDLMIFMATSHRNSCISMKWMITSGCDSQRFLLKLNDNYDITFKVLFLCFHFVSYQMHKYLIVRTYDLSKWTLINVESSEKPK